MADLFSPLQAGELLLPNRILMAPLTRCRAGSEHVANDLMAEHYTQRATAGLLIAEATMAIEGNSAFWAEPLSPVCHPPGLPAPTSSSCSATTSASTPSAR